MSRRRLTLFVFAAIVTAFLLNDRRFGAAPVSTGAETQIPAIEGIYRQRHEVRSVDGPSETAEDVVEIARYDPTHVFVRIVTRFDVGHSCGASGIATFENDVFVYRTREWLRDDEPTCTLRFETSGDELRITDRLGPNNSATCRTLCGARGSLSDVAVSRTTRRPIADIASLKASAEYVAAVNEFNAQTKSR